MKEKVYQNYLLDSGNLSSIEIEIKRKLTEFDNLYFSYYNLRGTRTYSNDRKKIIELAKHINYYFTLQYVLNFGVNF